MQTAFSEFFEDINDALREAVRHLGGNKKAGAMLRPELPVTQAENWLRDCLNPDRREKLSPEQFILVLSKARQEGYHGAMNYLAASCGYEVPRPVTLEQQEQDLQQQLLDAIEQQGKMLAQLQRIQAARPVRGVA